MNWMLLVVSFGVGALMAYLILQNQQNQRMAEHRDKSREKELSLVRLEEQYQHLQQELSTAKEQAQQYYQDLAQRNEALTAEKEARASLKSQVESWEARFSESKSDWTQQWKENLQQFLSQELTQTREQLNKLAQAEDDERHQRFSGLVDPVKKMLDDYQKKIEALDKEYANNISIVNHNVRQLTLAKEQLLSVLKLNKGTGQWGELQLMRLLELSGLKEGDHYQSQSTIETGRPDIKVLLTNNRFVLIDCKTLLFSTRALLEHEQENAESDDAPPTQDAKSLVKSIKSAVDSLHKKNYTGQLVNETPDFVVLFLPQESMLSNALEEDPALWEIAWQKQVLLSSPLTLIALLRMIAVGWNQQKLTENMLAVMEVGRKVHERVMLMADRIVKVEKQYNTLGKSVSELKSTYEGNRGLVKASQELEALGVTSNKSLPDELKEAPYKLDPLEDETPLSLETAGV